jgi:hypothetical protein
MEGKDGGVISIAKLLAGFPVPASHQPQPRVITSEDGPK